MYRKTCKSFTSSVIILNFFTAWISFKTNKLSWTITHLIVLLIVILAGEFIRGPRTLIFYSAWFILIAVVLRIIGYFNQKKINAELKRIKN